MSIRVEFYGIPRHRTGVATTTVEIAGTTALLIDVVRRLSDRFPNLARDCFDQDGLRDGFAANVNGERFVSDASTPLVDGSCLLILSADAGG
ncbi:MAG: MoaD/ThiS family protein [Pirellulaceae bacterium]|jgi:molybdopterin converting factor small subunit|nr:MoaD/ThiS family protein [Pirellulaceae bacterium]MDP6557446.1 MoaD/ThiS family protein [Pirellulaceae bacterium]